jgi:tungstate transport system ATP-binding protein
MHSPGRRAGRVSDSPGEAMRAPDSDLPIVIEEASYALRGLTILDRVSLRLGAGAPTVLIGPNGSGKTTLLRLLMGLIEPSAGRRTWGGRAHVPPARRAIVFQRPVMLRRSAAANIRYALSSAGVLRAQWPSHVAGLLGLVGLPGMGERPARKLSGGEQQRLALARALARDPQVLFLDEPTASLDPAATKAVEDVIRAVVMRGIKVVMATHDLGEARRLAGEIVLLHHGRVIETAPAAEFFAAPKTEEARRFLAGELLV